MDQEKSSGSLATVETTISILTALRELNGGRVTTLADHLDIPRSTVHRHLQTLLQHGYVTKNGDQYQLGLMFLDIGEYTRHCVRGYRQAKPVVDQIATETGERCQFVVEQRGRGVYICVSSGASSEDRTGLRVGKRMFLHSTASGKSILAHLPRPSVDQIIDQWGLPPQTPHTVTTTEELFEVLELVRDRGYAFNRGGNVDGLRAVGVPILDDYERVIGSISVSGPSYRMQGKRFERELPDLLLEAKDELQSQLDSSPS